MGNQFVKTSLVSTTSFVAGVAATFGMAAYLKHKFPEKFKNKIELSEMDLSLDTETSKELMAQTMLPTLLAARQLGWSPEMFNDNLRESFEIMGTIMVSLYEDAQVEGITLEEFREKIESEIEFLVISAKHDAEGDL